MAGSNMFIMYSDGQGNVTVSPRLGTGQIEPQHDTSTNITLLQGSGVAGNRMIANVRCANCHRWKGGSTDFTGSGGNWIYASRSGSPLDTRQLDARLAQHGSYAGFTWDYTKAQGGSDNVNPFMTQQARSSAGTGISPMPSSSVSNSQSEDDSEGDSSSDTASTAPSNAAVAAHGLLAAIAFLILFPTGAVLVRIPGLSPWVHAGMQIFAYVCFVAAAGLGIYLATSLDNLTEAHPIIGMVLLGLLFFQPLGGFLHHRAYKDRQGRTTVSYLHVWLGRACVLLGMVNGGLGIQLKGDVKQGYIIAYSVLAGMMGLFFVGVGVYGEFQVAKRAAGGQGREKEKDDWQS